MDIKKARSYLFCFITDNKTHLTHDEIDAMITLYTESKRLEAEDAGRNERKEKTKKSRRRDIDR